MSVRTQKPNKFSTNINEIKLDNTNEVKLHDSVQFIVLKSLKDKTKHHISVLKHKFVLLINTSFKPENQNLSG